LPPLDPAPPPPAGSGSVVVKFSVAGPHVAQINCGHTSQRQTVDGGELVLSGVPPGGSCSLYVVGDPAPKPVRVGQTVSCVPSTGTRWRCTTR
ncbi:MAG: hypothetical protein ABMA64_33585, partial [Myxococcota bacterium]